MHQSVGFLDCDVDGPDGADGFIHHATLQKLAEREFLERRGYVDGPILIEKTLPGKLEIFPFDQVIGPAAAIGRGKHRRAFRMGYRMPD